MQEVQQALLAQGDVVKLSAWPVYSELKGVGITPYEGKPWWELSEHDIQCGCSAPLQPPVIHR
ncbi:hypothetical protein GCM10022198_18330 [Klugiella xanthotipulae]